MPSSDPPKPLMKTHISVPPYCFTAHLKVFSLQGRPVPHIYDEATSTCRRLLCVGGEQVPVGLVFRGEP